MTHFERKQELLAAVLEQVAARIPEPHTAAAAAFVTAFYDRVDPDDLVDRSVDDLYGAALSHWHFAQERAAGGPKLRVYNPSVPEHGWQSRHTIVEMVNDDMPFLVDSVTTEVNRQGLTLHLIVHPVVRVTRDADGTLQAMNPDHNAGDGRLESFIQAEIDRRSSPESLAALQEGLLRVLADVRAAVQDWPAMLARVKACIRETEQQPGPQDPDRSAEDRAFLQWIADGNFTLLGCRSYDLVAEDGNDVLRVVQDSGLGILRGGEAVSGSFANLSPEVRARAREPQLLIIAKSNARATVHRPGYLDYIGIKRFDAAGTVIGEHRILGLFTSSAYNTNPRHIPLLRHKVRAVLERADVLPGSHAAKALQTILEQYPRDELIQTDADTLFEIATGILHLGERQRTRLFIRRDAYGRFFACLVFVPRDRYDTETRQRMQTILMEAFDGASCEDSVQLSESVLARVLFVIRVRPGGTPDVDARDLERRIAEVASRWADALADALDDHLGEEAAKRLLGRYRNGFPAAYREAVSARSAVYDIDLMEAADRTGGIAVSLYAPLEAGDQELRVKIVQTGKPLALSDSMPMLEHMGVRVVDERPYQINRRDAEAVWIHDFGLLHPTARRLPVETLRTLFHEAFLQVWRGEVENDNFNQLVLAAGLDWRQVKVLRAYAKYMRQAGVSFSQRYIENTLIAHGGIATRLVRLFEARFNPAQDDRDAAAHAIEQDIAAALEQVANLDEDRILRQFLALIQATLRTNFWRRDGRADPKPYVSFKFDPSRVPGLPAPRPKFEIFVFSPRVEGVHLRGGFVARGGLRWSDRMEDFRTEVLGLVKAQMVKNAVIVPTGSKGGFVVKRPPAGGDREALLKEGIACYETYLQGLLDLTDNLVGGQVVPPPDVVRHDGDDPYLVVAADKGTATFSDTANAVARRYGFWLDDAFASGGSAGYDHKKMGITARGAWESVKRHFGELGHDTQTQDFTVAGIGDMSGDVFGNGMLLSRHIRLIAAFDHRHIFLDPTPDAAASFTERERLFALPRSSWADYDPALISAGGGVWPRSAKAIPISPEARAALGVAGEALPPAELIAAILKAPVDLLYNGGIGTYIKAAAETHAQVGDRANDAIRVDGRELRCKVVGEGGNLGFTQRGRIEFATIDNSAGVDCSDHEVNIKILLGGVVADGELTGKQRDKLLAEMTDEVAALVLTDNLRQTQILSVMAAGGAALFDEQVRYMRKLEKTGRLNRALEYLPDDEEIGERRTARRGLTLPELSVLLAYSKIDFYDQVIASDAPDEATIARLLVAYFPQPLQARYAPAIAAHPLRREIIATSAINEVINRVGCTFAFRLAEETGAEPGQILRAFTVVRDAFGLTALWSGIEALPAAVPAPTKNALLHDIARLCDRAAQWLLRRPASLADLGRSIARLAATLAALDAALDRVLKPVERAAFQDAIAAYTDAGVPAPLARQVVALIPLFAALDLDEIMAATGRSADDVAVAYFDLISRIDLLWLNRQIAALPADTHWQALARDALRDDLAGIAASLTTWVFRQGGGEDGTGNAGALIDAWEAARGAPLRRYAQVIAELRQSLPLDMPMVSVALRELKTLARA